MPRKCIEAILVAVVVTEGGCATSHGRSSPGRLANTSLGPEAAAKANDRGLRFVRGGDPTRAGEAFGEALRVDPAFGPAHNNLGVVLLARRQYREAAMRFTVAKGLSPQAAQPTLNLARLYTGVGWFKEAAKEYEAALRLAPDNAEALARLAHAYTKTGKEPRRVETLLRRLAKLEGHDAWRDWALARLEHETTTKRE